MKLLKTFKNFDWVLIIIAVLLVVMGLLSIYSSCSGKGDFLNFQKQLIFLGVGFFLMIVFSFFDWEVLRNNPYLILVFYFLCCIGLVGLFFFAAPIRGVRSWYRVGPVHIDPIEFTKIVLIILWAKYFSMRHVEMYRLRHIILSGVYFLIPGILIFFQPDLGSVLILFSLWMVILIVSGIKIRHFLALCLIFVLLSGIGWSFLLKPYQKQRILSFTNSQSEPLGNSWNQDQAKIAVGSGGIFGKGIGRGTQTQYGFLPEVHTDFIFASLAEETGLVGTGILFLLFSTLVWRVVRIAVLARTNFSRLFASGFVTLLIVQFFIHVGMNIGVLPIIGISLPFVSYGGSGLIMAFIGLGILQSMKIDK